MIYDVFVLAILVFFAIRGAMKGVIWQIAGIAGIVLCFAFADGISAALGPYVHLEEPLNHWVVLFGSYLFFSFVSFGIARMMHEWIEKAQMTEFNRHLGAVFGLLKGVVLALILTFLVVTVSERARDALKYSKSGYLAAHLMNRLHPLMPAKLHNALKDYIHLLDHPEYNLPPVDHDHDHDHPGHVLLGAAEPHEATNLGQPLVIPGGSSTQSGDTGGDFWEQIRTSLGEEARQVVIGALHGKTANEQSQLQRDLLSVLETTSASELQQRLLQSGASNLDRLLAEQLNGTQESTTQSPEAIAEERRRLVRSIASVWSSIPRFLEQYEQQVSGMVSGLPDEIALAVLRDWKSDMWAEQPDPDPGTNMQSSVEQRITRQLNIAGIPESDLDAQMQQRLRAARSGGRTRR